MDPPKKRARPDRNEKGGYKFTSANEIRQSLRNQDELIETLTALRNQFTVRYGEPTIAPQDERLLLAQSWLHTSPGAQDIFEIWEGADQRQIHFTVLSVSVVSSLLTLLSSHYTYHPSGQPIIKTLLSSPWMRRLSSYLGGSHAELILVTLKLLNVMSAFAGGRERKNILESFAWEMKSLPKLLHMRRKTKSEEYADTLARPDIRTFYILFLLSFVNSETASPVKTTFLEQHRDVFLSIFKGLIQDSYMVVRRVLEICWAGIWTDAKVKRTLKIGIFNESTLSQIMKLYDRAGQEGGDPDHIPADLVHHFLLAICTRPGTGICFKDRGWYPREDEQASADNGTGVGKKGGKIYNKILGNILKTLKVNEDSRQQELALKIMTACPELVAGYWPAAALTLEPRLSSKWIANIAFFASVISLPVPSSSFMLPNTELYQPVPPPLSNVLENVLPAVNTKAHFSKGLQSTSSLVQHCTALALAKCLIKYGEVVRIFQEVEKALEEGEADGQWRKRRMEIEREARHRVPDFQVVVAFSQQKFGDGPSIPAGKISATRGVLLSESAQRLLWLYHEFLPSLVSEARFDVGKLLVSFSEAPSKQETERPEETSGLQTVCRLHVLRLLKESDQFIWAGKMASSPHSYLYTLLKTYIVTEVPAIRLTLTSLLRHIFSENILFQADPDEVYLWLNSLPRTKRTPGSEAPDGASLTDEGHSVIAFLDDCVQRCLKTPYRYLEDLYTLSRGTIEPNSGIEKIDVVQERPDDYASPLLMTVLEQLSAKIVNRLLTPSDALALASFLRKLVFRLSAKQQNISALHTVAEKVDKLLSSDLLFSEYPVITNAIRREVSIIYDSLRHSPDSPCPEPGSADEAVQEFLSEVEHIPVSESKTAQRLSAFELVDWLRLLERPLSPSELTQLVHLVERFHKPTLRELFEYLSPISGLIWDAADIGNRFAELKHQLDFEWLFIQCSPGNFEDSACRDLLVELLFNDTVVARDVRRAVCLISHSLSSSEALPRLRRDLLFLLASIIKKARIVLDPADVTDLKEYLFTQCRVLKELCSSKSLPKYVEDGLVDVVETSLDHTSALDKRLAADLAMYWATITRNSLLSHDDDQTASSTLWIKYMELKPLLDLFDFICTNSHGTSGIKILADILEAFGQLIPSAEFDLECEDALRRRLPHILALRPRLPNSQLLETVTSVAIGAYLPMAHDGHILHRDSESLSSLTRRSETHWSRQKDRLPPNLDLQSFLSQGSWTDSTARIVSDILYGQSFPPEIFFSWLSTSQCETLPIHHLAQIICAFFDTFGYEGDMIPRGGENIVPHFSRLLVATCDLQSSRDLRSRSGACVSAIILALQSQRHELLGIVKTYALSLPLGVITAELLLVGQRLFATMREASESLSTCLVDQGLQWAVRHVGDDDNDEARLVIKELTALVAITSDVKAHLTEPVLTAVIQDRLSDAVALGLVVSLLHSTHLKPVTVNRHLQSVIQHPQFFKLCTVSGTTDHSSRDAIVNLLHVLFNLHPSNTCQPTHVEPLLHIYGGTLSLSDRRLLSIFQLFEAERKTSLSSMLTRWSPSPNSTSENALEAIQNLDPTWVLRTCLHFPVWRRLEDQSLEKSYTEADQLYDPVFVVFLFARMLSDGPPISATGWVGLFRTNIVSLLIRALSSKDSNIREAALCQISALWKCLDTADLQEKLHVIYILNLLKNVVPPPSDEPPRRLPSYTSLILLHALRGVFYPSNFTYPLTARFLLQRPELDTNDVPMLYGMLYSSSDDWKKERGWIIRFLSDGMLSTEDWRVFKRRHTWDLLASLFQSSESDRLLRSGILEVLANLTCNVQATASLVLKSSLLTWLEMQLQLLREDEMVAWIKIIENLLTVIDADKLESSTHGEWRSILCRCLSLLLKHDESSSAPSALTLAVPVILRLSLLPGPAILQLPSLVAQALGGLRRMEESVTFPTSRKASGRVRAASLPPHDAYVLHDIPPCNDPIQAWGESVETLWRVAMTFPDKHSTWDALTCRLLLWRSMAGEEGSGIGEWARREVVQSLRTH